MCEDPIKCIYTFSGFSALLTLFLLLLLRFIQHHWHVQWGLGLRKMLGWAVFLYACLHVLNFVVLDMQLDFFAMFEAMIKHTFIFFGFLAFAILSLLALFSALSFKKYRKYFIVFDVAVISIALHIALSQKVLTAVVAGYALGLLLFSIDYILFKKKVNGR